MILTCQNLKVAFGDDVLFQNVSFQIREQEHVAIVGPNGCGKSTLLKVITSELSPSEGSVTFGKDVTYGYLAQYQDVDIEEDIYHHVLHANEEILRLEQELLDMEGSLKEVEGSELETLLNRYHEKQHSFELMGGSSYRSEVTGVLKGLGFIEEDFTKTMDQLSGGQKTRVNLARLLMQKPDLLLLDEPINHLDLASIEWLENFLLNYKGAVLIVAHDRYFLDHIVETVIDLSFQTAKSYKGNYSAFSEQKRLVMLTRQREFEKQQKEIAHQEEVITKLRQFNREKSIKRADSRVKQLEKMDKVEKLTEKDTAMKINLEPDSVSGNDVLTVEHLQKAFDQQALFSDVSFEIHRGEHVALLGDNGTGKTTILKILNDKISADGGKVKIGTGVHIAYYDQEQQQLNDENTLFDELKDSYPNLTDTKVRNVLAAFLFTGDDAFKKISALSGGERGRVSLAKLMLSGANFLILDEPTNHLDMESKDILESALNGFSGTVFYVSHDRYFINQTAHRILELRDETLYSYLGNYDYYLSKRDEAVYQGQKEENVEETVEEVSLGKLSWEEQKKAEAAKRKIQNQISKIEEEIEAKETRISEIDEMFMDEETAKNSAKLNELSAEQKKLQESLAELYEKWEELNDEIPVV
ncbi:MAG: ABC-F family ATP-binding cassette domain-containing protein [Lachnospiraceae bacterium]|nr:ABC-F family ATP-binding cassette domain-containing protein [Lachnospiraceae bacterium]